MSCACDFGAGLATRHCAGCCRTFTSISAFDLHQRIEDGRVVCSDPAEVTKRDGTHLMAVIRHTRTGSPVWGRNVPDTRTHRESEALARPAEGDRVR